MADIFTKTLNTLKDFMGGTVINTVFEIQRLIPDSILFGSLLLYFLTQNQAFGVFTIFIFETVLSHKLISWVIGQSVGVSRSVPPECRVGYRTVRPDITRMFTHDPYPAYGVFSITAIATYLGLATKEFSNTMDAMGPEWSSRAVVAYSLLGILLTVVFLTHYFSSCNTSVGELLMAAAFALFVGFLFFHLNKAIFGEEAMNFLGLPFMVTKESQGAPIYVCAAEKTE
jgi:hypothetical protein